MSGAREVRAQLRRILASAEFASSPRMKDFLQLAVNETLAGKSGRLKEYVIGVEVFRRPASFDPTTDPIVRVEARRLRSKLERYYANEGRTDQLLIELPKGGYSVAFRTRTASERAGAGTAQPTNTVAVLPFQAVGGTAEARQFSEGLTWELTHRLTRIDGLSVIAPESVARVGDLPEAAAAGVKLNAAHVLKGSVRQSADRIRIVSQLIATRSGVYVWSETYDRMLEDLLAIQDDIAAAIVARLSLELASSGVRPGYNPEAYQLYIRGRARWNSRTEEGIRASIDLYREALDREPRFALAFAGIADAYTLLADYALEPIDVAMPAAKDAAGRALGIDPTLGEAHCTLAFQASLYERNWDVGELHYRMALDLNPGYATAHHWYAIDLLALLGRFAEAREELAVARHLDPLSEILVEGEAHLLLLERRYPEALELLRSLVRTAPSFFKGHTATGRVLLQMGRYDEALDALETGRRMQPSVPAVMGAIGQALALKGEPEAARRILAELRRQNETRYVPSTCFALIHAGLGEKEEALDALERGCQARELPLAALGVHPGYDTLRGHPRFQNLLQRMNLPGQVPAAWG